jgi:pyruvate/2-oxoglutarate dehydrogenase complex dihydrolipoamide dehydrogenase (E3) component
MKYDAIVIGSGQAGNPLSTVLSERGWKVAMVEKSYLGGTCINTGCTPTKTMVASAQVAHYARNASRWGVRADNVRVDLPAVVARKNAIVQSFRDGHERRVAEHPNLHLYRGQARFLSPCMLQVHDDVIESEKIFIDTGTRPAPPPVVGLDTVGYLTNESLMQLEQLPEHLIVLGGGYIGLEFGQMFRRFGSRVTIIHNREQILGTEDADVANALQKALEADGIEFHLTWNPTKVEKQRGQIVVTAAGQQVETVTGSHLLVATGRRPNTEDLALEKARVATDSRGYVKVNSRLETNVPGIWALGDVNGGPAFTHISYHDYQIVFGNIIEGKNLSTENRYLPYSLSTDPPTWPRRHDGKRSSREWEKVENRIVSDEVRLARNRAQRDRRLHENYRRRRRRPNPRRIDPRHRSRRTRAGPRRVNTGRRALHRPEGRRFHSSHAGGRILQPAGIGETGGLIWARRGRPHCCLPAEMA